MKKGVSIILTMVLLAGCLSVLAGCGSGSEMDTYELLDTEGSGKVSFEISEKLGYEGESAEESPHMITLENKENLSVINARLYKDLRESSDITKAENSFESDEYTDFENVTIGDGYSGWSIWKKTPQSTSYETEVIVRDEDEEDRVIALDIQVIQSPEEKGKAFDTEEFVESEDFQNLLNSVRYTE